MELLTRFEAAPARTFGTHSADVWSKKGHQTVFARESLQPGKSVDFVTVLAPHPRGTEAAAVAEGISMERPEKGGVRVHVGSDVIEFSP